MTNERYVPTKAEMLAALVVGNASLTEAGATVQRSHRFPLYLFVQIENMARVAKVPVSVIINQLIECGLDAVSEELPDDVLKQLVAVEEGQLDRPTKSVKVEVKARNQTAQSKPKAK